MGDKGEITERAGKLKPRWEYLSSHYNPHKPPSMILAVQGGATNTTGVLFHYDTKNFQFKEVFRSHLEGSSLNHAPERALFIVRQFISDSLAARPDEDITVVMGMAGTEFAEGRGAFFSGLIESSKVVRAILTSDAETAWLSVFDKEGIIIIAGTGGITLGVTKDGQTYQSGGFGGPISDYPSATSLVFDYDRCSEAMSYIHNGKLETSKPLPLLNQWIEKHGGNTQNFFSYRSKLLTTSRNDEYASRAKDIVDYYKTHIAGQYDEKEDTALSLDSSKLKRSEAAGQPLDYCAAYAMNKAMRAFREELVVKNISAFKNVPFTFDGSIAGQLWQLMAESHQTKSLKHRKSPLNPDLIAGALRLIYEDIPVSKFRAMIQQK